MRGDANLIAMRLPSTSPIPLPFRLAWFYFAFFVYVGAYVAYFPPYLAARGLGPTEIAWVLALPYVARIVAPAAWGWVADRGGAPRGIVVFSCCANGTCFVSLSWVDRVAAIAALVGASSLLSAAALPLVESITLGALASQPGRYGPIRLWGSIGFIAAVLGGGAWLDLRAAESLPAVVFAVFGVWVVAGPFLPGQGPRAATPSPLFLPGGGGPGVCAWVFFGG